MQQPTCDICGDPTDATVCSRETRSLADYLAHVVVVAGEVETSVARLSKHGDRGGRSVVTPEQDEEWDESRRRLPVMTHGWAARLDKPIRGALVATTLPFHPGMEQRAYAAINAITTTARDICETRGIQVPMPGPTAGPLCRSGWGCNHQTCDRIRARTVDHPAARAATFLLTQLEWIRHHPDAAQIVDELSAAAATLRRCVDSPPPMVIVGICDCGAYLYAQASAGVVTCRDCTSAWDVAASREVLRSAVADRLVTAAEAATLLLKFEMVKERERARKTIVMWAQRGRIVALGDADGRPTYRFGDIVDRASRSVAA